METVTDNLHMRPMVKEDLSFAMRLHHIANWNQLEADWELLMDADTGGNYVAVYEGKDTGTVTTLAYQNRFSWIGMVLVDPVYRGRGIGGALLHASIAFAKDKGTIRLDATPQGEKLYKTLGFETERILARMERQSTKGLPAPAQKCRKISAEELEQIIKIDPAVFGADREIILRYLLNAAPEYAHYLEKDGKITGYCFGRPGNDFDQIGPVIAENQDDARDLLLNALEHCSAPVILDIFEEHSSWVEELKSLGFTVQRPFIRMYLGEFNDTANLDMQYAIAGPELG